MRLHSESIHYRRICYALYYDHVFLLARNRKTAPGKRFSIKIRDQSHGEGFAPSINAGTLKILFKLLFVISSFGLSLLFGFFFIISKTGLRISTAKRGLYNLLIRFNIFSVFIIQQCNKSYFVLDCKLSLTFSSCRFSEGSARVRCEVIFLSLKLRLEFFETVLSWWKGLGQITLPPPLVRARFARVGQSCSRQNRHATQARGMPGGHGNRSN